MEGIWLGIILFLEMIQFFVLIDIILSWGTLVGINFRPKVISGVLDPIYQSIRKIIPTRIGPFDFAAIIIIILSMYLESIILKIFPDLYSYVTNI